jgi:chemotaxis-related protein WspB
MLFLLFQLGKDRYALPAERVVEVVPMLDLKRLPHAPRGVAGIFIYRGKAVPAIDLSQLALGQPAAERLSTRILIVNCPDARGEARLLGLIAEKATEMLRKEPSEFVQPSVNVGVPPYLGPLLLDANGPIQWIDEQRLVPEPVRDLLFSTLSSPAP